MADRHDRRGRSVSVAGNAADEALSDLVGQFTDPYAFVRELIQNSLDAAARRIEVRMAYRDGVLTIEVLDDGEGMDRPTIEGYLLTLFRSTKEEDKSKIGKFGIGFVSLFAINPKRVVVDTGRDGIWHQVIFDEDRNYTLLEMDDAFEGTSVRLEVALGRAEAGQCCQRVHESAVRWCRYAGAEITTAAQGVPVGWRERSIAEPFTVPSPVLVRHVEDGFEAVLGVSKEPVSGFYNHGLLLWEAQVPLLEGVSFRVKGRHLEHTLTRDNVRRDANFKAVMARLRELAENELADAVHRALSTAEVSTLHLVFGAIEHGHVWTFRPSAPLFIDACGQRVSMADLLRLAPGVLGSLLRRQPRLLWARPGDPVAAAVAGDGTLVLAADTATDAHLVYAAEIVGATVLSVHSVFRAPRPIGADREIDARFSLANTLAGQLSFAYRLHPAQHLGAASVAVAQQTPFGVEPVLPDLIARGHHLMVDVDHALTKELLSLPEQDAGPLLLRAAMVAAGVSTDPVPPEILEALS